MFDLGDNEFSTEKANEQGVKLILRHPKTDEELISDDGKEACLYLVGSDSKRAKAWASEFAARYRQKKPPTGPKALAENIDCLVRCTLRSENIEFNGAPVDESHATLTAFYTERACFREQADAFVAERSNFLGL